MALFDRWDRDPFDALTQLQHGLDRVFELIIESMPDRVRETAYALACDVAAADGQASQEELRMLEIARDRLDVGRLEAAAIERGTRARYISL